MIQKNKNPPILDRRYALIDTHCHLDMAAYVPDLAEVLETAFNNGVKHIITVGIDEESSREAIRICKRHPMLSATVGIHPHDAGTIDRFSLDAISLLIEEEKEKIVGYGEIGLDYVKRYTDAGTQKRVFQDQLAIARNFKLPVIIHNREADNDVLSILRQAGPFDNGGIMHCFSGNLDFAKAVMDLGFFISIPGIVTFKNALVMKEVAGSIPLEYLLVETDGPFLAPEPFRGKRNEPVYVLYTANEIARLRDISLEDIASATTANAIRLFNLPAIVDAEK